MCIPKEIVGKERTIVVFPRKVGLDVSHVVCGVMCRLGEQLSMTDGSTMQTSFHCDIADKKAYQCTECAADYVGSPVGGGLLPLAPVSHNPRVDVVSSTLTTLPPTINVIKKYAVTDHIHDKGISKTPTQNKLIHRYRKATERIISNYDRRKTHMDRRQPTSCMHPLIKITTATVSILLVLLFIFFFVSRLVTARRTAREGFGPDDPTACRADKQCT